MSRPRPPADFDENPPLDDAFWERARPTRENLERALRDIIAAHRQGRTDSLDRAVDAAETLLSREG